jgi:hypothetical protein
MNATQRCLVDLLSEIPATVLIETINYGDGEVGLAIFANHDKMPWERFNALAVAAEAEAFRRYPGRCHRHYWSDWNLDERTLMKNHTVVYDRRAGR